MRLRWGPGAVTHMWQRHRVTTERAEEALDDPYVVVEIPDPTSRSGLSDRYTGGCASLGVTAVIVVRYDGDLFGANAWPANDADRKFYWERRTR